MNLTHRARACVSDAEVGELSKEGLADLIVALSDNVERALRVKVRRGAVCLKADHRVVDEVALLSTEEGLSLCLCLIDHRVDVGISEALLFSERSIYFDLWRRDSPAIGPNTHEIADALLSTPPPPHRAKHARALKVRACAVKGEEQELIGGNRLSHLTHAHSVLKNPIEVLIVTAEPTLMR